MVDALMENRDLVSYSLILVHMSLTVHRLEHMFSYLKEHKENKELFQWFGCLIFSMIFYHFDKTFETLKDFKKYNGYSMPVSV